MNSSQSFPPADAAIEFLRQVDYRKHYNSFMDSVENLCIIIAAICIIIGQQWRKHRVSEKMQISAAFVIAGSVILSAFVKETVAPFVMQILQNVWRICYTVAQPPLTV